MVEMSKFFFFFFPWEYAVGFLPNLSCKEGKNQTINALYLQTTIAKVAFKNSCQSLLPWSSEDRPEKQEVFLLVLFAFFPKMYFFFF